MGVLNSYASDEGNIRARMEVRRYSIFKSLVKEIDSEIASNMHAYQILGYDTLLEWVLAALSGVTWTDVAGRDFSNDMELKSRTIYEYANGSRTININSLKNKVGDLIVVVFDPKSEEYRFFNMPFKEWRANMNDGGRGSFTMSFPRYSTENNWWNKFEKKNLRGLIRSIRK
jgi:hypothetical protein